MPSPKRIITVAEKQPETKIKDIAVRSLYPSRLKYVGAVSGKEYEWRDAGATVMVLQEDVPTLLSKRIGGRSCCGALNQDGNQVFELVQQEAQ